MVLDNKIGWRRHYAFRDAINEARQQEKQCNKNESAQLYSIQVASKYLPGAVNTVIKQLLGSCNGNFFWTDILDYTYEWYVDEEGSVVKKWSYPDLVSEDDSESSDVEYDETADSLAESECEGELEGMEGDTLS
jgi:hypothetical protein